LDIDILGEKQMKNLNPERTNLIGWVVPISQTLYEALYKKELAQRGAVLIKWGELP
jgi:hypothetical protein